MGKIDYELLRIRYELFGESIDNLSLIYEIPPDMLQQEIEERGWKQHNLNNENNLPTDAKPGDLTSFAATFTETVKNKLTVLSLARQLAFADDYAKIERELLKSTLKAIKTCEDNPRELKNLAMIFKDLTANSVTANIGKALQEDEGENKGIIVQILNEIKGEKAETNVKVQ